MEYLTKKNRFWGVGVSYEDLIWMSIIVLYCINFFNVGVYIPLLISPVICIYLIKFKFNATFTITIATLISFSILYAMVQFFYKFSTNGIILMYLIYPSTLYVLGYIATNGEYKKMYRYIVLIIISSTLFSFLSLINTILTYGSMTSAISAFGGKRLVMNLWDDSFIAATGVNTTLSFGLAMFPIVFLKDKNKNNNNAIRIVALLSFVAATYCILLLGNRTGLGIIVFSILITILFVNQNSVKRVVTIILTVTSIFLLKLLFNNDIFGLQSAWDNSLLFSRLQSSKLISDSRINAWKITFTGLIDNPMGGKETFIPLSYAHNLWLDVAYEGGVFPFITLIIFTIISALTVITFQRFNHPVIIRGLVIALTTAFLITFMVEPILQGWFTYFNIFCFIIGMIQRQNTEYKKKVINT